MNSTKKAPVLGCIADDVTGATDLAVNLVNGGLRVIQIFGQPGALLQQVASDCDAVVLALKTRSIPKQDAIEQSLQALRSLQSAGIERFYFKYCSTFDSTTEGNIGPVAEASCDHLGVRQTIYCPSFPRAGRTVFRGHLFVGDSLLNESGMESHPLNPMTDANLVRFLAHQTERPVGLLSAGTIARGPESINANLVSLGEDGVANVICDTCHDSDLQQIASAVASMKLVTGGSGLARFLPDAYRANGWIPDEQSDAHTTVHGDGRALVIAGSCSRATRSQVAYFRDHCSAMQIDVAAVIENADEELNRIVKWATESDSTKPLMFASTSEPSEVAALQERFGADRVATAIEQFLATLAKRLVPELGIGTLILAGGETSGAVTRSLGIKAIRIGPEICAGVPWTQTVGGESDLALALKSGNFGDEAFFKTALDMIS